MSNDRERLCGFMRSLNNDNCLQFTGMVKRIPDNGFSLTDYQQQTDKRIESLARTQARRYKTY
jgi:hypothetical protein